MASSITFKRGDTAPRLTATLYADDAQVTPLNLTGASVQLHMALSAKQPGELKVDAACSILDAAGGRVGYDWQAADTDTAGSYLVEFEVTWSDGSIQTFPRDGYLTVTIVEDLD